MGWSFEEAPLSSLRAPVYAGIAYVVAVLVLERHMRVTRSGRGFDTKYLQVVHNTVLSAASLVMALGTLNQMVARAGTEGSYRYLFCENHAARPTGELYRWSYIYCEQHAPRKILQCP